MDSRQLFETVTEKLRSSSQITKPELEARWIIERAIGNNGAIDNANLLYIDEATQKRLTGMPLAYVLGEKEFFGLNFMVNPNVLIPRPETEHIIELALEWKKKRTSDPDFPTRIIDMGTGSGCIGLTILKLIPHSVLFAVDVSVEALDVADFNAKSLGVHERANFLSLDAAELSPTDLPESFLGNTDLLVANPPYISNNDSDVDSWVRQFEPALALFSDEDGLGHLRRWIQNIPKLLAVGGLALIEIGHLQAAAVIEMALQLGPGFIGKIHQDLSGKDRVISIERKA